MKKLISYILTFLLVIVLVALVLITCVKGKILSSDNVLKIFDNTNFYENTYNTLNDNFSNYMEQSGLDESVIKDIITVEDIKTETKNCVESIYNNTKYTINKDDIERRLNENINSYLDKNNRKLNSNEKKAIATLVSKISDLYATEVFPIDLISKVNINLEKISNIVDLANVFLYVCAGVLLFLLIIINIKSIMKVLNYVGVTLLSSGIVLFAPKIFVAWKMHINDINIYNRNISDIIINFINEILNYFTKTSIIFIVIAVVLLFVANLLKKSDDRK